MLFELETNAFDKVRPLFAGLDRVAIHAIIEGNCPSRLFVNDAVEPTTAFTWNEFRYGYLAGDANDDAFNESLRQLLAETLFPEAKDSHDPSLVVYPHPGSWREKIGALVGDQLLYDLVRSTFSFAPARFQHHDWRDRVPPGFRVQRVDEALLAHSGPEIVAAHGILWRSAQDFLEKGLGYCLLDGDEVVCTCFSAFAGGGRREIGVDTHPGYRRRGFATLTASAFMSHCLENGWEPGWECWADNVASIELAGTLGFERGVDYPVYFIDLER
jgi:RimJ/RimL family protein N-acetyltransferase